MFIDNQIVAYQVYRVSAKIKTEVQSGFKESN